MARILRGEIRWANLNPVRGREQSGNRPVLILSHDVFNERSGTVICGRSNQQAATGGISADFASPIQESSKDILGQNRSDPHPVD